MKIGILQAGHSPDVVTDSLGDYADMFTRLLAGRGFDFEIYSVVDNEFPTGPEAADGWLITGSKHGAYEDHDWIPPLEALIRDIRAAKLPLIGICFGHQIIAQALGGKVEKFEGGWSVGRQTYRMNGQEIALNAWHQDQVVRPPEGAEIIAESDFCANAGMLIDGRIFTLQPHPEFGAEMTGALIEHRGGGVPDALLAQATATLDAPVDNPMIAEQMATILKSGAAK
ncbi:MAG: glutamine amidotransferase [Rhodobacterales bacterium]|nr:MAG: glutamine amidotransferase [Rhodobacterales bacterium]